MSLRKTIGLTLAGSLAQSLFDNLFYKTSTPKRGSIVYCKLAFGQIEHSGIYVGNDQIIHRNGKGVIEQVSSRQFVNSLSAITIYVSCGTNGHAVSCETAARLAESSLGNTLDYSLLNKNCHQFCCYCLNGDWSNELALFSQLKKEAHIFLKATQWRAWDQGKIMKNPYGIRGSVK
ncbi:lecithin retinol acyltransferase family protein [Vibrio sp. 1F255]|uniref:lecithin retinol acyltransferase family protein n=1 Tax=Vibrio sp. 1F255 TaxID=3230009 RepID=UPI00352BF098